MQNKCDKCGAEVPVNNDVTIFEAIRTCNAFYGLANSRHLLPIIENGEVVCEGSPSRAQYIEGQPRDTRGYAYNPDFESEARRAYDELQNFRPLNA